MMRGKLNRMYDGGEMSQRELTGTAQAEQTQRRAEGSPGGRLLVWPSLLLHPAHSSSVGPGAWLGCAPPHRVLSLPLAQGTLRAVQAVTS